MSNKIMISSTVTETFSDWPNDEDSAVIVYFVGCSNNCPGCQNAQNLANKPLLLENKKKRPEIFISAEEYLNTDIYKAPMLYKAKYIEFEDSDKGIQDFDEYLKRLTVLYHTNNIILQGGDPLYKDNATFVYKYCELNANQEKFNICIYTGSSIEEVNTLGIKAKYFKCGKFDKDNYQAPGKTRESLTLASTNQEFYDHSYEKISKNGVLSFNK